MRNIKSAKTIVSAISRRPRPIGRKTERFGGGATVAGPPKSRSVLAGGE
jgi:hypothetical protein